MTKKLLVAGAFAVVSASVPAQITRSGAGYLLRVKYAKGSVIRLTSVNSASGMPGQNSSLKFVMPITLQVLEVKRARSKVRISLGAVKSQNVVLHGPQTVNVWLNNRNMGQSAQSAAGFAAQLPQGAVRVGQSWRSVAPVATGFGPNGALAATYTFKGIKGTGGNAVALIGYTLDGMAKGKGSMTLYVKDGTLASNELQMTMDLNGGTPVAIESTMRRN